MASLADTPIASGQRTYNDPVSRVRFDAFELDLANGELRKGDVPVRLQPQPLKVLMLLAGRAGRLVARDEIRKQLWDDETFVDFDQGLNYCVRQIRAALSDEADTPRFIETIPRRGYRFVADVVPVSAPVERRVMLVVLPFQNLSSDPEQDYFSDGLTEEMIAQLGRLNPRRLGVIARTSAMRYKQTDKAVDAIGRELGVSHVLEGSVRRAGNRVRVTAQLIQVSDQTHTWARSFERAVGDILALQSDMAHAIATEIGVQLTPHEQVRLATRAPVDPSVYEAYLKGRHFWKRRSRAALEKSVHYFDQAIEMDPRYAPAYAGLADVHLTQLDYNYVAPREAFALADRVLLDALRLDNALAEPHTSLGHLRLHQFNWVSAEQQFMRAIELNPGYDTAHYYYANLLAAFGRFDQALAEANLALELDPISPNARQNRLFILYLARRYELAVEQVKDTLELDPTYTELYYYLGHFYERTGDYTRAIDAFQKVGAQASPRGGSVLAAIGYAHAQAGDRAQAIEMLSELKELSAREYVSSYDLALLHLALDDRDETFVQLSKAYDDHSSYVPFLNVDARFDPVRSDPRFRAIIQRLNFPAVS
jgi:TolB-like protein/tetratricopeptide (TPR) repeat protein